MSPTGVLLFACTIAVLVTGAMRAADSDGRPDPFWPVTGLAFGGLALLPSLHVITHP